MCWGFILRPNGFTQLLLLGYQRISKTLTTRDSLFFFSLPNIIRPFHTRRDYKRLSTPLNRLIHATTLVGSPKLAASRVRTAARAQQTEPGPGYPRLVRRGDGRRVAMYYWPSRQLPQQHIIIVQKVVDQPRFAGPSKIGRLARSAELPPPARPNFAPCPNDFALRVLFET